MSPLGRTTPILRSFDEARAKPQLDTTPWGERYFAITDPFGNRLVFFELKP